MNEIKQIKREGAAKELKVRIDQYLGALINKNWYNIRDSGRFCRLEEAISDAENAMKKMRALLAELQKLEPENK